MFNSGLSTRKVKLCIWYISHHYFCCESDEIHFALSTVYMHVCQLSCFSPRVTQTFYLASGGLLGGKLSAACRWNLQSCQRGAISVEIVSAVLNNIIWSIKICQLSQIILFDLQKWIWHHQWLKKHWLRLLTHLTLVSHVCISELGQHWFR